MAANNAKIDRVVRLEVEFQTVSLLQISEILTAWLYDLIIND